MQLSFHACFHINDFEYRIASDYYGYFSKCKGLTVQNGPLTLYPSFPIVTDTDTNIWPITGLWEDISVLESAKYIG